MIPPSLPKEKSINFDPTRDMGHSPLKQGVKKPTAKTILQNLSSKASGLSCKNLSIKWLSIMVF